MKLLSIVVPCYNSQEYMRHCIDSLLQGGEDVEIIIVNDGSNDNTATIADEYQQKHSSIVRVIHQENGGHGVAVMTGIHNAKGLYFKVVDSDDWVDGSAYEKIIQTLQGFLEKDTLIDLLISNFVYEKQGAKKKRVMSFCSTLPQERVLNWDEIQRFRKGQYLLMHSVIYRTQLLHDCRLDLPRHTFYVDELYVYIPLPYVKTLYYLNVDFYRYFIGREDQSVNEKIMIERIDQVIKVNKLLIDKVDLKNLEKKSLQKYMFNYVEIITMVSSTLMIRSGMSENLKKKKELWEYIKEQDLWLYRKLRFSIPGILVNFDGLISRILVIIAYKISQKTFGFN